MADKKIEITVPETVYNDAQKQLDKYFTSIESKLTFLIEEYAYEYRKNKAKSEAVWDTTDLIWFD